ncbi:ABC transporter permease [Actinotalea sp. BY-33]|uniref:ABC transporter permease n=1 Tax=Actinotalea soli TaxID=2819234 RepID=A0A939RUT3_9CELL|nr:ABC transporter permease [Actinotalea soli]MBO1753009.1 ABC transporter permease [Actinotalea soli]
MGRRLAALRATARIARRQAARSRGRTALVATMVVLPVLAAVVIDVLVRSAVPTGPTYARYALGEELQARVTYVCPGEVHQVPNVGLGGVSCGWSEDGDPPVPQEPAEVQDRIEAVVGPAATVIPALQTPVRIDGPTRGERMLHLAEVDLEAPGVSSAYPLESGSLPRATGELALAPWLAESLDVLPGDDLVVTGPSGQEVHVELVGVLDGTVPATDVLGLPGVLGRPEDRLAGQERTDGLVDLDGADRFVGLDRAEWLVAGPAPITWDMVLELNAVGLQVASREVLLTPPAVEAVGDPVAGSVGARTLTFGAAVVGAGLLEAVLLIGPAFAVGARRQTRALALLAAQGAERRDLRRVVLWGAVVIGVGASVGAAALGVAVGALLVTTIPATASSFPNLVVPWLEVAVFVLVGVLIAVAAAWLPARTAARVDVVAALAGRRSEARPRRAVPLAGLVLLGVGVATSLAGAVRSEPVLATLGVLLLMVGMVAASGAIVTLIGSLARWAPLAPRLAMRDAARQRGRTAPALAAVIAAVAGATAGLVYVASEAQRDELLYSPVAEVGVIQVGLPADEEDEETRAELLTSAEQVLESSIDLEAIAPVSMLVPTDQEIDPLTGLGADLWIYPEVPVENQCPLWLLDRVPTEAEIAEATADPRCDERLEYSSGGVWATTSWSSGVIMDDGSATAVLGLPGSEEAAAALARGEALVHDERALREDGTVELAATVQDAQGSVLASLVIEPAARATGWASFLYQLVLPPESIEALEGEARAQPVGLVARSAVDLDQAEVTALRDALEAVHPAMALEVERPYEYRDTTLSLVILAVLGVVGLGATWLAVGLAAAESRADLATLAAVGAAPRTRRLVAGAQAGVIAVTGTVLGVLAGALLGGVFVELQTASQSPLPDRTWQLVMPWPGLATILLGLPTLAVLGMALATRSRLPLVRRIAS